MELLHGGDIAGYELRYGKKPVDFSASLNPLGMPAAVAEAARQAVDDSVGYPDPLCRRFRTALSAKLGLPAEWLCIGNGAADVIFRLAAACKPKTALLTAPTFAEYEQALVGVGCPIDFHLLDAARGFRLDDDILDAIPGNDLVVLCQPNNPTGQAMEKSLLLRILQRCEQCGAKLAVDQCFCAFLDQPDQYSLTDRVDSHASLIIFDSFTKLYAMAGIRLGYALSSDADLIQALHHAGQPWSVSTIAQAAGLAALEEDDYVVASLALIREEKKWLRHQFESLGQQMIGGDANYLFFQSAVPNLVTALADRGILIRDCGNFRGLASGYYRVAVRTRRENDMLITAFRAVEGSCG